MGQKSKQIFNWLKQVREEHGEKVKNMTVEEIYDEGKKRAGNALKKFDEKKNAYFSKKK